MRHKLAALPKAMIAIAFRWPVLQYRSHTTGATGRLAGIMLWRLPHLPSQ